MSLGELAILDRVDEHCELVPVAVREQARLPAASWMGSCTSNRGPASCSIERNVSTSARCSCHHVVMPRRCSTVGDLGPDALHDGQVVAAERCAPSTARPASTIGVARHHRRSDIPTSRPCRSRICASLFHSRRAQLTVLGLVAGDQRSTDARTPPASASLLQRQRRPARCRQDFAWHARSPRSSSLSCRNCARPRRRSARGSRHCARAAVRQLASRRRTTSASAPAPRPRRSAQATQHPPHHDADDALRRSARARTSRVCTALPQPYDTQHVRWR